MSRAEPQPESPPGLHVAENQVGKNLDKEAHQAGCVVPVIERGRISCQQRGQVTDHSRHNVGGEPHCPLVAVYIGVYQAQHQWDQGKSLECPLRFRDPEQGSYPAGSEIYGQGGKNAPQQFHGVYGILQRLIVTGVTLHDVLVGGKTADHQEKQVGGNKGGTEPEVSRRKHAGQDQVAQKH